MRIKQIFLTLALLCAVVQGAWAQANWDEVYAMTQTTVADWTQLTEGSTTGRTLGESGTTKYYYAGSDLTFTNSTYGGSGLTILGTVYLYVPEGVTVTCKGTSGLRRTIGSGAGIELTEGNTLYLIGTGTVNAEGGLASGGETGNDGGDAGWDGNNYWSGTGGRGGNGGGGAGAGIGTRGGDGGMGAYGAASVVSKWDHAGGGSGAAGLAGATAGAMGKLYVAQSFIHLTATGGSAGWMYGDGSAGSAGKSILDDDTSNNYCAAGGGGGGGGGFGGAAAGIGTGGPGGGGSGGGASGNLEWCRSGYYVVRAPGGKGGQNGDGTWAPDGAESILNYENLNNGKAHSNSSGWSNNDSYISNQPVGTGGSGGAAGSASISVNSQVISIVTSETTTMTSGYYYVLGDVTVTERITVNGNVTLNLDKDATLNAPKGIELSLGNSLTINGPGALTIDDVADSKSGIGAMAMGALTINGGQLTITGGNGVPGIGSDTGAGSGTLTLGWNAGTDFIACSSYAVASITFAPGKTFYLDGTKTIATPDNIGGKKLVPFLDNQCGNGIAWYMTDTDGNGSLETLNILHDGSGTGAMADYSEDDAATAPWITYYGSDITAINISDGVTHVGNNAFRGLTGIVEVTLGASVTSIGTGAFASCSNLSRINMLNGNENLIVGLDESALQNCDALTAITVTKPVLYMKYAAADQWKGFSSKLRLTLGYDYLFEGGGSTSDAYYKIATADDLRRLAEAVNAGNGALTHQQKFCQTADIDLAGADFPGIGWRSDNESFQGNYDGGEHTISGLSVSSSHDCAGLFGYVSNSASLRNFYLVQPTVTTTAHTADPIRVGAVAGFVSSAFIENCHVIRPTLSATGSGTKYIGAIVGEISGRVNSLVNCFYNRAGDLGGIGVNHGLACTIENIVPVYGFVIDNASVELPNNLYTFPNGDWYLRYIKKDLGFNLKGTFYLRDQLQFKPTVKVTDPGIRGYATRLMFDGQVIEPDEGATSLTQVTITVSADIDGKTLSVGSRSNGQPQEVTYVDAHGLQHTTQATLLDGYEPVVKREGAAFDYISLAAGTYFVGIDLDYTGVPIYPNGDITLILGNGRTMRFGRNSNPTTCPAINDYASNLTIYGQSLDADIAGTLRYVGENSEAIHVGKYTQHSGNVILHSRRSSRMGHCLEAWNFTLNGGTLSATNNADEGCAINANTITINGGQLTAKSIGKELCFGLYAGGSNGITLGWTHPDDFICASSYFVEKGTIVTTHVPGTDNYQHFTLDDGTTLISGTLDAATLAGSTLRPTWVGLGTESDPYLISFTSELDLLSARVSGAHGQTHRDDGYLGCYFRLTNDIAYPYTTRWDDATSTENNFEPIGREYAFRFRGDFDGGGHTVSGIRLYISPGEYGTEGGNVGIFGTTGKESYIHDLTIADANITGLADVGGIVGYNRGTITRCHAANNFLLRADENGSCCFGGITGSCPENSVVTHCTSAVTIVVSDRGRVYQVGGIVGDNVGATMTDNLVFGATIPAAITSSLPNSHGAITGRPYETNLANNYYSASNVAGIPNAIGIGSGPIDSSYEENCDLPENDGIVPLLRDQADNTAAIEHVSALSTAGAGGTALDLGWGAGRFPFQLAGRTLYKDGSWNTLCLPFAVAIEDSPLEDATIMMLDNSTDSSTGFDAATGTLHLDFVETRSIEPGVAYLVKWNRATDYVDDDAHNIVNPVFYGATVSAEAPAGKRTESADGKVAFTGTYAAAAYDKDTPGVLFLGADNKLYYPKAGASIGAFRAMFRLNGITAGEPKDGEEGIKAFALDFGNENSTLVSLPSEMEEADAWYDLSGRRLEGKPSQRGIYVTRGRKVVIK